MLTTSHIIYRQIFDLNQIKLSPQRQQIFDRLAKKKYSPHCNFDLNQIKFSPQRQQIFDRLAKKKYSPHCNFDLNQIKIVSI